MGSVEDPMAIKALKYMLLSKVMLNLPDEVTNLVSGKLALRHSGPDMESMKAVALAAKARSLADFQKAVKAYKVQLDYVASKIGLPKSEVEKKLSQMILDKKFQGILDQETGVLIIFTKESRDKTFDDVIETVSAMNCVVDRLYQAAKKLT